MGNLLIIPFVILICPPYSERLSRDTSHGLGVHGAEVWVIKIETDSPKENRRRLNSYKMKQLPNLSMQPTNPNNSRRRSEV